MIILLSPAKIQNFNSQQILYEFTQPEFIKEADKLVKVIRQLSAYDLSKLLNINTNLAHLNADRYFNWKLPFTPENAKQAILVFNGEVFHGLDAKTFTPEEFEYSQSHLRILSGLYGVLRPLDLIQPYRLEISTKLNLATEKDLYNFWTNKVTNSIKKTLEISGKPQVIINLASNEYFKSININKLKYKVINFEFLQNKEDDYKSIVIYTKKARGLMARYIIENRIENPEDLKGFAAEGYWYSERFSTSEKLVFTR
ncbi:MAG: peroxide stress protein YaaA [Paludibacter sp.]